MRCLSNPGKAGFIKDEAGGGTDGKPRRQWACQRSNGRSAISHCPRVSCTEYIELARQQVDQDDFNNTVHHTCQKFPESDVVATLKAYITHTPSLTSTLESERAGTSCPVSLTQPKKRRAEEELPAVDKSTRHSVVQERQGAKMTHDVLQPLPVALQQLKALIEMSKTWQEQHDALLLFLASSPLRPTLPTEMPSSSLPDLGLQVPPLSSPPPLPDAAQRRALLSDATIPCTSSPGLSAGTPSVTSLNTA